MTSDEPASVLGEDPRSCAEAAGLRYAYDVLSWWPGHR